MSFVQATPEFVEAAAGDLARIGSTITSANTAAMGPTSGVLAPRRRRGVGDYRRAFRCAFPALSGAQRPGDRVSQPVRRADERRRGAVCVLAEVANTAPLQIAAAQRRWPRRCRR